MRGGYEPSGGDFEQIFDALDGETAARLIAGLPKKYQKIMRMRYAESLTIGEIAEITEQSKNAVAVQIHRGIMKLRILSETR